MEPAEWNLRGQEPAGSEPLILGRRMISGHSDESGVSSALTPQIRDPADLTPQIPEPQHAYMFEWY